MLLSAYPCHNFKKPLVAVFLFFREMFSVSPWEGFLYCLDFGWYIFTLDAVFVSIQRAWNTLDESSSRSNPGKSSNSLHSDKRPWVD